MAFHQVLRNIICSDVLHEPTSSVAACVCKVQVMLTWKQRQTTR